MEHTKLPWRNQGDCYYAITSGDTETGDYEIVLYMRDASEPVTDKVKANMDFLLKAVNNHYKLVDACKAAAEALKSPSKRIFQPMGGCFASKHDIYLKCEAALAGLDEMI